MRDLSDRPQAVRRSNPRPDDREPENTPAPIETLSERPIWAGTTAASFGLALGTGAGLLTGPLGAMPGLAGTVLGFAAGVGLGVLYDLHRERVQFDRWEEDERARARGHPLPRKPTVQQ